MQYGVPVWHATSIADVFSKHLLQTSTNNVKVNKKKKKEIWLSPFTEAPITEN